MQAQNVRTTWYGSATKLVSQSDIAERISWAPPNFCVSGKSGVERFFWERRGVKARTVWLVCWKEEGTYVDGNCDKPVPDQTKPACTCSTPFQIYVVAI